MSELSLRQTDALDRIEQKPELQRFFFSKIRGLKWFDELESRGFFNPNDNPEPVPTKDGFFMIPSWPVLEYLEASAPEIEDPANRDYSGRYLRVIRDVTQDAIDRDFSNYRTWWYFAKLLKFVDPQDLTEADFELIRFWLEDRFDRGLAGSELGDQMIPRLLTIESDHCRTLAELLLRTLTELSWKNDNAESLTGRDAVLAIDGHDATRIFDSSAKLIGDRLEEAGLSVFHDRLNEILSRTGQGAFSSIWRPAIESHEQNLSRDHAEHILINAYRDALLGYTNRRDTNALSYLESLLDHDESIFQRLALYVASQYPTDLASLRSKILTKPFFNADCRHEMYHLLKGSFSGLEEGEKQQVLAIIDEVAQEYQDQTQPADIQEKQRSYEALRWLHAIRGQGHEETDQLYAGHLSIAGSEPEHPDFSSYMTSGWVGESSDYSAQELLSRNFEEMRQILTSYEEKPGWNQPTRHGLALCLKGALLAKPDHFRGRLLELTHLDYDYIYLIIDGYRELWSERGYDNWGEILGFCTSVVHRDNFWAEVDRDELESMYAERGWVVGSIADLVKAGTASDDKALPQEFHVVAGELISDLLLRQEGASFTDRRDALTTAINSPRGKCVQALINCSLHRCRLVDKESGSHSALWEEELVQAFDHEMVLTKRDNNYEFAVLFAAYILNLLYLDEAWTLNQLPWVFDKENRGKWLCAIDGYTYVNQVHHEVYGFLRDNGHLIAALEEEELDRSKRGRIVENIVVAYLSGNEQAEDEKSPLFQMLERGLYEEIHHLVWFVWTLRDSEKSAFEEKILPLWERLSDLAEFTEESQQKLLSSLCLWVAFIQTPDNRVRPLALKAAPYADLDHNAHAMVTELRRLVGEWPKFVANVYLQMLTRFAPVYPEDEVTETIAALYRSGEGLRSKANDICDRYIEHGVEFPRHIRAQFAGSLPEA